MDKIVIEKYSAYKDSGIEWLGVIPDHWEVSRLGKILTPTSVKNQSELPLLSITREKGVILRNDDEEENHNFIPDDLSNYKVLRYGEFGMNKMKAWQGSYGVSPFTGIVSPAYYTFITDPNIVPKFFHIAIRSRLYVSYFGSASDGVRIGQWDLSKDRMKHIPFLIPSIEEQNAIANFLDRKTSQIVKAIAQKEQLIELLKERRQILIHKAVTRGLDPNVKMKESGVEWIGEIPEHWEVKKLKYLSTYFKGNAFSSSDFVDEGIPIVKASNIKLWGIEKITSFIAIDNLQNIFKKFQLQRGDIIVSTVGSRPEIKESAVGQLAVINEEYDGAYLNQNTVCIRPNSAIVKSFLKLVFTSNYVRSSFDSISLWIANQAYLEVDSIMEIQTPLPPLEEQKVVSSFLEEMNLNTADAISIKEREIEKLKEYKATLINAAVTGKIKVC